MWVTVNYAYKNKKGKKTWGSHVVEYRIPNDIDERVLDELLKFEIHEKTGREVKRFTMILRSPDNMKRTEF